MRVYIPIISEGVEKYEYNSILVGVYTTYELALLNLTMELIKQEKISYEIYVDYNDGAPPLNKEDFIQMVKKECIAEKRLDAILDRYGSLYKYDWAFKIEERNIDQ